MDKVLFYRIFFSFTVFYKYCNHEFFFNFRFLWIYTFPDVLNTIKLFLENSANQQRKIIPSENIISNTFYAKH